MGITTIIIIIIGLVGAVLQLQQLHSSCSTNPILVQVSSEVSVDYHENKREKGGIVFEWISTHKTGMYVHTTKGLQIYKQNETVQTVLFQDIL